MRCHRRLLATLYKDHKTNEAVCRKIQAASEAARVKQLRLNQVHKIFKNLRPLYLQENFVALKDVHQHNTRSSELLSSKLQRRRGFNLLLYWNQRLEFSSRVVKTGWKPIEI